MKLTTKCPKCSNVFDVSLETLQKRKGFTRCINCAHIFDGFEEVVPETNDAQDSKTNNANNIVNNTNARPNTVNIAPTPLNIQPKPTSNEFIIRTRSVPENKPPTEPNHKISDLEDIQVDSLDKEFVISDNLQSAPENNHSIGNFTEGTSDDTESFYHVDDSDTKDTYYSEDDEEYVDVASKFITVMWVCLIAAGVAIFLLQAVYVFRVQIAESMPNTRPRLQALCDKIGCDMPWVRKPEHVLIVHSSLQSQSIKKNDDENKDVENDNSDANEQVSADQSSEYVLQVVLRNTYDQDQEWPSLILELTDAAGAKIARKNITAQQYLTADYINKPFLASSEYQVQLPIKLQGLKVNGYQVTTFFP